MEYNSGNNGASDLKTPELYDTKSFYQLIMSLTKCDKLFKSTVLKRLSKSKGLISESKLLNQ